MNGLEFKPAKVGPLPELTGVIWVDARTSALRYLNFDYVNLPIPLRVARTMGRVDFEQLPGGQWIVPRWYIRMPRTTRVTAGGAGSPSTVRDSLVGYQEVGGTAHPTGAVLASSVSNPLPTPGEANAPAGDHSMLTGVVFDGTTGRPLKDVEVSTKGGRFRAVTNAAGRYELTVDGSLSDKVFFDHPRLRLFRIPERVQTISLPAGTRGEAGVLIPSYGTLRKRLCAQNETGTEAQGMAVGYVKDPTGNPVPNAHVWATWQIEWIEQNGRLVSTNQQRTVETDTGPDGSYMMCGFSRGAQVTAKVGMAGRNTVEERLLIPSGMVLEHDFQLGAR
jgi:protocatechuate 3,4-dioxygenase beta subunit